MSFGIEYLVGGGVCIGLFAGWLRGFFNQFVWSPARARLALANSFQVFPVQREDKFRIVLCWLKNDDNGKNTEIVEAAFSDVRGIKLMRSARIVSGSGAADDWKPVMQRRARAVMSSCGADLAIAGVVGKSRKVLRLWFLPRSGEGTLDRGAQPYTLENVTLGDDFHGDLVAQVSAAVLTSVAPLADNETRGLVVLSELQGITEKLSKLLDGGAVDERERRSALQMAYGKALTALGERESGTARLEEAVAAYRAALEERTRARAPLDWAGKQNGLGNALSLLGERESGTARLEEAVAAYRAALEELPRAHAPRTWAMTQNNLGNALSRLGEQESGTARLEEADAAYRAALEERPRDGMPLDWASTQNNLGGALLKLGEREDNPAHFEEASEAFHAAFEEFAAAELHNTISRKF